LVPLQKEERIMAVRQILHYPDPLLAQKSEPVTVFDEELKQLIDDMIETMYDAPGVGLAAPQIGVLKRLVIIDCSGKDEPADLIVAVNPEVATGEGTSNEEEGCLSVPRYYANIKRHATATLRYQDQNGEAHERTASGLLAVAFQHETDHLEGTLFVDHLSSLKKSMFRKKYAKMQKEKANNVA
jgi:peptide deformylase